jgi:hypothetical protein
MALSVCRMLLLLLILQYDVVEEGYPKVSGVKEKEYVGSFFSKFKIRESSISDWNFLILKERFWGHWEAYE